MERFHAIPVTSPTCTLVDIATYLDREQLEAAINEADRLDRPTFTVTDSRLERKFLPIARRAGLPPPRTRQYVNGWRVDFYWPELGLVIETDGLRYHRTPFQQGRDRVRDQSHVAAGLTTLRFTRAQIVFEPGYVQQVLAAVARHSTRPHTTLREDFGTP